MNDKYEYLFLIYMYNLLGLREYEEKLKGSGIVGFEYAENGELFKYFSLLSKGDSDFLSDEEKKELELLSLNDLSLFFTNDELRAKSEEFLKRTYQKYFFSNVPDEDYIYYGPVDYKNMAPSDAIVLGINYKEFVDEVPGEMYEDTLFKQSRAISSVINEIQEDVAPPLGIKVAVLKRNELSLTQSFVL